jgi:chemotaxis protein MotB
MARKKEPEKPANHERWLVSYGDFITLLFAVFVTLYAMSQVDKKKVEQVAASYRSAFGITVGANAGKPVVVPSSEVAPVPSVQPQPPPPATFPKKTDSAGKTRATHKEFRQMAVAIEKYLGEHKALDQVSVEVTSRGLVISLKEAGFFDSGSAVIKPGAFALLADIAQVLRPYDNSISFEGHTDNLPIRSTTFPSNWELSSARATNLAHHFMDRHGFAPQKFSVTGYGEYRPVTTNSTEEGRKQNRRVDLVLLGAMEGENEPLPMGRRAPF